MDNSSANSSAVTDFDHAIKIMEYHYNRMRDRRSLGMKVFFGVVAVTLLLIKGYADLPDSAKNPDCNILLWTIRVLLILIAVLFLLFMISVEGTSKKDRIKYNHIGDYLWKRLKGEVLGSIGEPKPETIGETLIISWAGTWPVFAYFLLVLACWIILAYL